MRFGAGEGTTRRTYSPSGLNIQPFSAASARPSLGVVDGTDELRRVGEGGIVAVDLDHREERGERDLGRQEVAELLLDHVADHPLGLGAEDVERVRLDLLVRRRLQREQAHLRPVAVRQHELVVLGDRRERPGRDRDVGPLGVGGHGFTPLEQGVATEGDEDAHESRPQTPKVATMTALIVWSRFSAWSNTIEAATRRPRR